MASMFADRRRLRFHLIAWGLVGALLALLAHNGFGVRWRMALAFGVPLGLLAAPLSFSAWFMARAMPLSRTAGWQLVISSVVASVIAGSVWASVGRWWWRFLGRFGVPGDVAANPSFVSLLLGFGALAYLLSLTVQYALQATEDSASLAQRDLQLQIAAREAELRALRAQVDPHFLFNSLNAVSGLIGPDPERAREMIQRLADFLRSSLTLGAVPWIELERELALVSSYLEIERVRFGARLSVRVEMEEGLGHVQVPPLLLQPLVENAVRHGIATCLEGGTIQVEARRRGAVVWLTVSNPRDGESTRRGTGLGLDIVRRRLSGAFGTRGALAVEPSPDEYRVSLTWPLNVAEGPPGAVVPPGAADRPPDAAEPQTAAKAQGSEAV
jgi:signal transduction histidine kinase